MMLALVGCDHATKLAAEAALGQRGPVDLVPGVLDLRYVQNHDTVFSLLQQLDFPQRGLLLSVLSVAALTVVAVMAWRRRSVSSSVERVGFALIAAGALGNVTDRLRRGYVVDFIHLQHWPVFNVADVLIVGGVALLGVTALLARLARSRSSI
jgi:signal peptidase II